MTSLGLEESARSEADGRTERGDDDDDDVASDVENQGGVRAISGE